MAALLIFMTGTNLQILILIKGSTTGYINAFVFPIVLHLKCVYFDRSSGEIRGEDESNK